MTTIDERSAAVADTPTPSTIRRDRAGLLTVLDVVDREGWDGPTGCALLGYVRATVVRPQVAAAGLRGPAAEQAEATGQGQIVDCPTDRLSRERIKE